MKLYFKTNLDEAQRDVHALNASPGGGAPVPRKGERIVFEFERGGGRGFRYELEVCAVAYNFARETIEVELHIPSYHQTMSINDWTAWFNRHRHGRGAEPSGSEAPRG